MKWKRIIVIPKWDKYQSKPDDDYEFVTDFGWDANIEYNQSIFNMRTGQYEVVNFDQLIRTGAPELLDYMPQHPALPWLYQTYLELGVSAPDAYAACLRRSLGQVDEDETE